MFRIEILCTGDEILSGKTVNTNYSHMARRLVEEGFSVSWGTTVGDDRTSLAAAFRQASVRADAVIVNGGLGPTVDDLSQEVAAEVAGVGLELNESWFDRVRQYYSLRGREMPPSNRKQAMLPMGSEVIDNPIGTACGFALTIDGARFFFTPGVPREMKRMLDDQVIPRLRELSGIRLAMKLKRFHSFGIGESRADGMLRGVLDTASDGSVKLGFQSHYPELETKLTVQGTGEEDLRRLLEPVEAAVRERLGNFVVAEDDQTLEQRIIDALKDRGGTLSTMEMFTGGGIVSRLLPLTDSGDTVRLGIVSRELEQLATAARLDPSTVAGGITTETAMTLANGLRSETHSSHALVVLVSLGRDPDKPALRGDIRVGIADRDGGVSRQARLAGGPDWVRLGAIEMGLDCLRRHLYRLPVDERIDFEESS